MRVTRRWSPDNYLLDQFRSITSEVDSEVELATESKLRITKGMFFHFYMILVLLKFGAK